MAEFDERLKLSSRLVQELYHKYAFDMYADMPYGFAVLKVIETGTESGEAFFIYANSAFLSMTDTKDIDIKGCSYTEIMGRLNKALYRNLCRAAYNDDKSMVFENIKKDGAWFNVMTFPLLQKGYCAITLFDAFDFGSSFLTEEDASLADRVIVKISKIIHSADDDFEINMHRALRFLGDFLGCERSFIIDYFHGQPFVRYEWFREEEKAVQDPFQASSQDPWLVMDRIGFIEERTDKNKLLLIKDANDGEDSPFKGLDSDSDENADFCNYLINNNIRSMIAAPYYVEDNIAGYFVIDNFKETNTYAIKYLVEIITITLFSEIHSRRLVEKLAFMGTQDQLTNVNNRNAMNIRVCELDDMDIPVGVVYADVNGLKAINDALGHDAGDVRIIQMATILSKVFLRRDIFRVGGDEFVVIMPQISKEEFDDRIDKLKRITRQLQSEADFVSNDRKGVFFSLGAVWSKDCHDLNRLLKKADSLMYEEKKQYYKELGYEK